MNLSSAILFCLISTSFSKGYATILKEDQLSPPTSSRQEEIPQYDGEITVKIGEGFILLGHPENGLSENYNIHAEMESGGVVCLITDKNETSTVVSIPEVYNIKKLEKKVKKIANCYPAKDDAKCLLASTSSDKKEEISELFIQYGFTNITLEGMNYYLNTRKKRFFIDETTPVITYCEETASSSSSTRNKIAHLFKKFHNSFKKRTSVKLTFLNNSFLVDQAIQYNGLTN